MLGWRWFSGWSGEGQPAEYEAEPAQRGGKPTASSDYVHCPKRSVQAVLQNSKKIPAGADELKYAYRTVLLVPQRRHIFKSKSFISIYQHLSAFMHSAHSRYGMFVVYIRLLYLIFI